MTFVPPSLVSLTIIEQLRGAVRGSPWLALSTAALVAGTGFANGGYFPSSWGWPTTAAAFLAAVTLLTAEKRSIGLVGCAAVSLLAALTVWTVLSSIWSIDVTQTVLEAERTTVYVAALLAALIYAQRSPERLLHGVWAAATLLCGWGLVTRLVPDRFGVVDPISGFRLSQPVGYWNGLGLLAAIGTLIGLGLAARASSRVGRALAVASLPVLVLALYFTFSRGAWVALALGFAASVALDPRRLQLLATAAAMAAWPAVAVWRATELHALTTLGASLPEMARQGHRLAIIVAACSVASALTALAVGAAETRVHTTARQRRTALVALASIVLLAVVAPVVIAGGPAKVASKAWHSFSASGGPPATGNLNGRLFHLSGNGRTTQWEVAWRDAKTHSLLGSGAGTFERVWAKGRPLPSRVRDAHNLYLETLAELGPFGLALLAGALGLPIVAGLRRRREPLVFAALGAYLAFLAAAAVDWDWELASVTLAAVLCGAALLAGPGPPLRAAPKRIALAGALLLAAVGIYVIASQIPLSRLDAAVARGDWSAAERDAERASRLAPWSAQPWHALGEAELASGRRAQARVYLRRAVAKSPNDWTGWLDLARATSGPVRARAIARARTLNPLEPQVTAFK
jgi:O-antigen ligase